MDPVLEVKAPQRPQIKADSYALMGAGIKAALAAVPKVISKDALNKKIKAGEPVQIVNVLDPENYALGIIKGSKKIPLNELDARFNELDKSKPVVTYCASRECRASKAAAEKLAAKGFDVKVYEGGIKEWKRARLLMEAIS